jgi:acetylornithine deacetylase/succinyl-diaminopimelate desuccinylase-like protein
MIEWTKGHIERLGGKATLLPNPVETEDRKLPPILLGEFPMDPKKKTVCVYGHLDVQPAAKEDGWEFDPFVLTEKDGKLFGRGSTDDKGPALSWLWIVEAHQTLGVELPVNIKIMYEGMEEFGSDGMFETIQDEAKPGKFLNDVVRGRETDFLMSRRNDKQCSRQSHKQNVNTFAGFFLH